MPPNLPIRRLFSVAIFSAIINTGEISYDIISSFLHVSYRGWSPCGLWLLLSQIALFVYLFVLFFCTVKVKAFSQRGADPDVSCSWCSGNYKLPRSNANVADELEVQIGLFSCVLEEMLQVEMKGVQFLCKIKDWQTFKFS